MANPTEPGRAWISAARKAIVAGATVADAKTVPEERKRISARSARPKLVDLLAKVGLEQEYGN